MREIKIWYHYTINSFEQMLSTPWSASILLAGKIIRVSMFTIFLWLLFQGARSLAGFSKEQIIFFYLSFNLSDTIAQLFFREVYRFRSLVVSGNFDLVLAKPVNPLLRVLLGGADLLDLVMLLLLSAITAVFALQNFEVTPVNTLLYVFLLINGLLISFSFHVVVLGLGIITTSVDHLVMIYRDTTSLLRIPIDLYAQPLRFVLTFIIPLGVMITFPASAFLGLLSWQAVVVSIIFSLSSLFLALKFWNFSLKKYSSASS